MRLKLKMIRKRKNKGKPKQKFRYSLELGEGVSVLLSLYSAAVKLYPLNESISNYQYMPDVISVMATSAFREHLFLL